jgi:hypothetical protein
MKVHFNSVYFFSFNSEKVSNWSGLELVHPPTSSGVWARRFWKFLIELNFVAYEFLRIHQYWFLFISSLAGELDRGKIKCRRFGLFRKKQKKQGTEDERYISRCIISIELEDSNDHWQKSSIEREKTWKSPTYVEALTEEEIPYGY